MDEERLWRTLGRIEGNQEQMDKHIAGVSLSLTDHKTDINAHAQKIELKDRMGLWLGLASLIVAVAVPLLLMHLGGKP